MENSKNNLRFDLLIGIPVFVILIIMIVMKASEIKNETMKINHETEVTK